MRLKNVTRGMFAMLFATTLFIGCDKKEPETPKEPLPAKEAKETLKSSMNSFYDCLKKGEKGSFADFLYYTNFVEATTKKKEFTEWIEDPTTGRYEEKIKTKQISKSWFYVLEKKFGEQFDYNTEGADISSYNGTYSWNIQSKEWKKEPNNSGIVLKFPAKKEGTTNNATLVLKNYSVEEVSFKGKKQKFPKTGEVTLTIDNKKVFGAKIENIQWKQGTNFSMPINAKVTIYTNPFTTTIDWNRKSPEVFALNCTFQSPEGCSTNIQGEITLNHSNYENYTDFNKDVKKISLNVSHNSLNIVGSLDVEGLNNLNKNDYTAIDLNTYAKVEVFDNGRKVADLKADTDDKGDIVLMFVFSDGSKEKAENYVSDIEERLKKIFKRFIDSEVND